MTEQYEPIQIQI